MTEFNEYHPLVKSIKKEVIEEVKKILLKMQNEEDKPPLRGWKWDRRTIQGVRERLKKIKLSDSIGKKER